MNSYDILFSFRLLHDYYEGSLCREVSLLPSSDTARLLKRRGLILRQMGSHEWAVVNGDSKEGVIPLSEDDSLEFLLLRESPLFQLFTDYSGFSPGKSRRFVPQSSQGRIEMGSAVLSEEADDLPRVFLRVEIALGKWLNESPKGTPPWLELHFSSKSFYWEYYMVPRKEVTGSLPELNLSLEDQEKGIEFEKVSPAEFNGRQVYVFRSKSRIPMRESYLYRLSFKEMLVSKTNARSTQALEEQEVEEPNVKMLLHQVPFPTPGLFPSPTPDTLRHVVYF